MLQPLHSKRCSHVPRSKPMLSGPRLLSRPAGWGQRRVVVQALDTARLEGFPVDPETPLEDDPLIKECEGWCSSDVQDLFQTVFVLQQLGYLSQPRQPATTDQVFDERGENPASSDFATSWTNQKHTEAAHRGQHQLARLEKLQRLCSGSCVLPHVCAPPPCTAASLAHCNEAFISSESPLMRSTWQAWCGSSESMWRLQSSRCCCAQVSPASSFASCTAADLHDSQSEHMGEHCCMQSWD